MLVDKSAQSSPLEPGLSIKMENMILNAFPRLKENGMWTKYRKNKRHQCKCYITLPLDHLSENVAEIIKSQVGFDSCKVKVIKGINNVPEKAHKVVAIGVRQTISEDDIKAELAKNNVKIGTRKVVVNEQDMKIALFSGIYFGRMRIRCESYRTTPQQHNVISVRVLTMSLKIVKVNKNVLDVLVPINPQNVRIRMRNLLNLNVLILMGTT